MDKKTPEELGQEFDEMTKGFGEGSSASDCSAISFADIEAISDRVGMSPGGWDCVDPREIIKATLDHFKQNANDMPQA